MGTTLVKINSCHWEVVCLMAVTDPELLIQVLTMGMERDKNFPRTVHPMLRHLSYGGCISFGTAVSPRLCEWSWEDELTLDTSTLWAKTNFNDSHRQRTNIILVNENCLSFWSCALFWATWYLVFCLWKEWGRWELLVQWAGPCLPLLCPCGGKCPWTGWLARNAVTSNTWHRNAGWVLQCGEEWQGGLLRWTHLFIPSRAFPRASQLDSAT